MIPENVPWDSTMCLQVLPNCIVFTSVSRTRLTSGYFDFICITASLSSYYNLLFYSDVTYKIGK